MTHAQLTIIAEAARDSITELLYAGYDDGQGVDLEVGFEREQAEAAGNLAYNAAIKAGEPFVRTLHIEVD
jgi:hypothetical protein